jgi:hypothetical protein
MFAFLGVVATGQTRFSGIIARLPLFFPDSYGKSEISHNQT